jgi:hypothetical protein
MPRATVTGFLASVASLLPDNVSGLINPVDVRTCLNLVADVWSPGYCALTQPNSVLAVTSTPVVLPWATNPVLTPDDFDVVLASGIFRRKMNGLPTTVTRILFEADLLGPNNAELLIQVSENGTIIPGSGITVSARGTGNVAALAYMTVYSATVDTDYRIMVSAPINNTFTFQNARLVAEVVPTIGA